MKNALGRHRRRKTLYHIWCARCILLRMVARARQMSGEVSIFSSGTTRAEECGNRRGIVGRVEKLGRRRKLDVRGGSGHHFPTSNVQRAHQANRDPTEAEQGANPKWHFLYSKIRSGTFLVEKKRIFPKRFLNALAMLCHPPRRPNAP